MTVGKRGDQPGSLDYQPGKLGLKSDACSCDAASSFMRSLEFPKHQLLSLATLAEAGAVSQQEEGKSMTDRQNTDSPGLKWGQIHAKPPYVKNILSQKCI